MQAGRANPYRDSGDRDSWPSPDGRPAPDPYDGRSPLAYRPAGQHERQDRTVVIVLGAVTLLGLFVPMIAASLAVGGSFVFGAGGSTRSLLVALVMAGGCAIAGLMLWIVGLLRTPDRRPPLAWLGVIAMTLPQLLWPIGLLWWI